MKVNHITKSILNEVDFNRRDVVKRALSAPIQCGFEIEMLWTQREGIDGYYDQNKHSDRINSHTYDEIVEYISRSDVAKLESGYEMYIDSHPDFESMMADAVSEEIETDEYLYNYDIQLEYIVREIGLSDAASIVTRKFGIESPSESEIVDKIFDLPGVEDALKAELISEHIDEISDIVEESVKSELRDRYDHDHWVEDEFGSMSRMMSYFGIDVIFDDDEMNNFMSFVASKLSDWAHRNSVFDSVVSGETHEHSTPPGFKQNFWRVEPDSSISSDSRGSDAIPAEIVSPVYDNIDDMLKELNSLFEFLSSSEVETNSSTGLHITMSYAGEVGDLNRLKVIALLDEGYLLSKFKREMNGYTLSQKNLLIKELNLAYGEAIEDSEVNTTKGLRTLERIVSDGFISSDKYRSAHFKGVKNDIGNELVEFRIIGSKDYHTRYDEIRDTTIRYASTLLAAYDPSLYKRDYLKKLTKILSYVTSYDGNVSRIDPTVGEVGLQKLIKQFTGNYPELRMIYDSISVDIERYGVGSYQRSIPEYLQRILEEVYEKQIDLKIKHRKAALNALEEAGMSVQSVLDSLKVNLMYQADSMPKSQVRKIMGVYKLARLLLTGKIL